MVKEIPEGFIEIRPEDKSFDYYVFPQDGMHVDCYCSSGDRHNVSYLVRSAVYRTGIGFDFDDKETPISIIIAWKSR